MTITARPEVLPPAHTAAGNAGGNTGGNGFADDRRLDLLSHLRDDFIRIPGTPIRFGLDGIVGFFPGIGDILGGLASSIIIIAAWMRGVPGVVVARMVLNVAIETVVGAVPVLGNLFDIGWKANRRNYALLTEAVAEPGRRARMSWLFIAGVSVALAGLMFLPMLLLGWLLLHAKAWLGTAVR